LQSKTRGLHLEVSTPDVNDYHGRLLRVGIEPVGAPRDRPWGERTFNVKDPDGNLIEFQ